MYKKAIQYIPRSIGHIVAMIVTMRLVTMAVTISLELRVVAMDLTVMTMTSAFAFMSVVILAIQHAGYANTDLLPMLFFVVCVVVLIHCVSRTGLGDSDIVTLVAVIFFFFAHDDSLIDTSTVAVDHKERHFVSERQ